MAIKYTRTCIKLALWVEDMHTSTVVQKTAKRGCFFIASPTVLYIPVLY
jgi:hypothetical protein